MKGKHTVPNVSYPLDTTGLSTTNKIVDEVHVLSEINSSTYRIVIPQFAPFYLDNFKLTHIDDIGNVRILTPDLDYSHCLLYVGATRSVGKTVYGGVTINTEFLNGTLKATYQTVGGDWIADPSLVLERLAELVYNPRTTVWDSVTNKPNAFPPTVHAQHMDNVVGHKDLVAAISALGDLILNNPGTDQRLVNHLTDMDNPHDVTKEHLGLGEIPNYGVATDLQSVDGSVANKLITPANLAYALGKKLVEHYTKAEVSELLGQLNDLTPQNVVQTIDSYVQNKLTSPDAGNQIQVRANGVFYGVEAPPDVAFLYIDAVNGNDGGAGTRAAPMKTIQAALARGPAGISRWMMLRESQDHRVEPSLAAIVRGGVLNVMPYGPLLDAIPHPYGAANYATPAALALNTRIVAGSHIVTQAAAGEYWQNGAAFIGDDAVIEIVGITLVPGSPLANGVNQSRQSGSFSSYWNQARWRFYNCKLTSSNTLQRFFDEAIAPLSLFFLAYNVLEGPATLVPGNSKFLTVNSDFGGHTQEKLISMIPGTVTSTKLYSSFNTNMTPP